MLRSYPIFESENEGCIATIDSEDSFFVRELLWGVDSYSDECLYEQLVFKVFRQPKRLISHIQRIYFTYHHKMQEQLYAALVDFLFILNGKGKALGQRMVYATRSLLSDKQFVFLKKYLSSQDNEFFKGNKFTIFTSGMIGRNNLLSEIEVDETSYDALDIARDYIEFSQLDAAKETLELAVFEAPRREDIQVELIGLYKVTKDYQSFISLNKKLKGLEKSLSPEWLSFSDFVAGITDEKQS